MTKALHVRFPPAGGMLGPSVATGIFVQVPEHITEYEDARQWVLQYITGELERYASHEIVRALGFEDTSDGQVL